MARHASPPLGGGFTLIEILIVVLIVGIVTSIAVLSLGKRDRQLEQEAKRLAALISLSADEAVLQGRELALEFDTNGYHFLTYDGNQWQALQDDDLLKPRQLPQWLSFNLSMEGESVTLKNAANSNLLEEGKEEKEHKPRIYLFSSGEITPFSLTIQDKDGQSYEIEGDTHGKLTWIDHETG